MQDRKSENIVEIILKVLSKFFKNSIFMNSPHLL